MTEVAVRVEGLGKRYRLGQQVGYKTLRETLLVAYHTPTRIFGQRLLRMRHAPPVTSHELSAMSHEPSHIWALKDVSFEVKRGEAIGIIGRNGSGKSTLLKVLSRITAPTEGRAEIHGRVGSLLEVGTGFHPELTGRENIYLNGAIIGMKKAEIERKFDEIVAFAEIERFLDTPVKRYSSGMYVRLAFSVAAHLEPEILIVDEVLAVGDASFQKKCLGKMGDVAKEGRTVLFVSHNMSAITRLCQKAALLETGRLLHEGPAHQVVSTYLNSVSGMRSFRQWPDLTSAPGNDIVRLHALRVLTEDGRTSDSIDIRRPVGIEMDYEVVKPGDVLVPNYHFFNQEGVCAFVALDHDPTWKQKPRPIGRYVTTAWIPGNFLAEGTITVGAAVSTMDPVKVHFYEEAALAFQVIDSLDGDSARGGYAGSMPGVVRPLLKWTTRSVSNDTTNDTLGRKGF